MGPFIHHIDPVIGTVGGVYLWWYGMTYTLGFLGSLFWLRANRTALSIDMNGVYSLSIYLAIGVLAGGRLVEVIFYEWAYYGSHLWHIPAVFSIPNYIFRRVMYFEDFLNPISKIF